MKKAAETEVRGFSTEYNMALDSGGFLDTEQRTPDCWFMRLGGVHLRN